MKLSVLFGVLAFGSLTKADCEPGYFECPNSGQCIPETWVCDGDNDCGDRSDEPETCPACPSGRWECDNGNCIPITYICDGDNDCGDGSDERDPVTGQCPACPDTHFQCTTSGKCIPTSYICDGDNDCGDMSDEPGNVDDCPPCAPSEFQCSTGRCISGSSVCNGRNDCQDPGASDENQDCPPCPEDKHQCSNGACALAADICDGSDDCGDNSDERDENGNCPSCPSGAFTCPGSGRCINPETLCNGVNNCGDWSDETEEACPCAADEVRCSRLEEDGPAGKCVPPEWVCDEDGIWDCPLGEDEANCTTRGSSSSHKRLHRKPISLSSVSRSKISIQKSPPKMKKVYKTKRGKSTKTFNFFWKRPNKKHLKK